MTKQESIILNGESEIGSPYVYGAWGSKCTPALRRKYASYNPSQREITFKRCQQLRDSNPKNSCDGCKYKGRLAFDCRGFVHWLFALVMIIISGQAVGSQWNDKSNWAEKGDIAAMPDLICVVFIHQKNKWKHVGVHVGGGRIIHCSGEVKTDQLGKDRNWTHYAIPNGLYTAEEIKKAHKERGTFMRILRKGCQGEDVRALQEMLNALGFSCGKIDGIFGANTEAAVKAFQAVNALKSDGIAGEQTLNLLAAKASEPEEPEDEDEPAPEQPAGLLTREQIKEITELLKKALAILESV